MPAPKEATINDVAQRAGVSIATVSRVLNSPPGTSRSPHAHAVLRAADELGYRRNTLAAGLRSRRTGVIGVIVPFITDPVMALLFESLQDSCTQAGLFAVSATSGDDPAGLDAAVRALLNRGVDGIIVANARTDCDLPASLRTRSIPHVLALRGSSGHPAIAGDDHRGGYEAMRHLLDLGHRNVAIVSGPSYASSSALRVRGAHAALAKVGIDPDTVPTLFAGYRLDDGARAAAELSITSTEHPTAIFAANDYSAIGLISACAARGVNLGDQFSIIGFNDIALASHLHTPLSSIHVPFDDIATKAVEHLTTGNTSGHTMPVALVPRQSTRPYHF